jgi:hypothetical protein
MLPDFRAALRRLRANLGFTAFAVVTIAVGIGATTAIHAVAYATLFRPMDIKNIDEVSDRRRHAVLLQRSRHSQRHADEFLGAAAGRDCTRKRTPGTSVPVGRCGPLLALVLQAPMI